MSWCSFWEQDDLKVIVIVLERKISSKFHFRLHGFVVHSVMSSSSWPHGLQHTRLPWPSLSSRVFSNSCPLSPWCHPTISSSVSPSPPAFNLSQYQGVFHELALHITFSISPSNEYSGLISFRIDWFDVLPVQGTLKSLLQHHSSKASISLALSFLHSPTLTYIHDHWKNHSLD